MRRLAFVSAHRAAAAALDAKDVFFWEVNGWMEQSGSLSVSVATKPLCMCMCVKISMGE
jgi:hypothetical protein